MIVYGKICIKIIQCNSPQTNKNLIHSDTNKIKSEALKEPEHYFDEVLVQALNETLVQTLNEAVFHMNKNIAHFR